MHVIRGVRDSHGLMVKEVDPILGPEHDQLENIIRRVQVLRVCDEHWAQTIPQNGRRGIFDLRLNSYCMSR